MNIQPFSFMQLWEYYKTYDRMTMRSVSKIFVLILMLLNINRAMAYSINELSEIEPSTVDKRITKLNDPSYISYRGLGTLGKPLVVFLNGTGGKPRNLTEIMDFLSDQGFSAIGLSYINTPGVSDVCPRDPDPTCSEEFRKVRITGEGKSPYVFNQTYDGIITRLSDILKYLANEKPDQGWQVYLSDGLPNWRNIIIAGFSQGAGMAAYIGKHYLVQRVVLFSGPWDYTETSRSPAPWLYDPSITPMDRWYAGYHVQEETAEYIMHSYTALGIPSEHILQFNDSFIPKNHIAARNPFHLTIIHNRHNAIQWKVMFGRSLPEEIDMTASPDRDASARSNPDE
jgi:dienelactone hydrolase